MDCTLLSKMIVNLLKGNPSVSLEGFGIFIKTVCPATFSEKGFSLNPPYVKVVFSVWNDDMKDDGAVVGAYAEANGISQAASRRILGDFYSSLRSSLICSKSLLFPGLGELKSTRDGTLFFVQDENLSVSAGLDSLRPVSLRRQFSVASASDCPDSIRESLQSQIEPVPQMELSSRDDGASGQVECGKAKHNFPKWVKIILWAFAVAAVLLSALAVAGRLFPDIVDLILYDAQELEILRTEL